jgi:hypothetical protein
MRDMDFIAGKFLTEEFLSEKEYLRHYYTTELEKAFLNYFVVFEESLNGMTVVQFHIMFSNHTGIKCCERWTRFLIKRYKKIEEELSKAYAKSDLERIAAIKTGRLSQSSTAISSSDTSIP